MVTCHDFATVERSIVERAIGEKRDGVTGRPCLARRTRAVVLADSKAAWPAPYRSSRMIGRRLRLASQPALTSKL